ncbi:MAG: histidinol dehydrogenase [Armatimonadota bacterium]|nr:histidinol dehydrogenase [bacterium]MCS7309459.1 histidinol dehydrogenase [Armatimonadota bacterium]MDW8104765.1 histidinol dehydrogenase [Armatimonadota bacterium]MDW8290656.1 histidinol dehydrogenase [Armatimonadota bacterium]
MRVLSTDKASREEIVRLLRRSLALDDAEIESRVRSILHEVALRGDDALREYTARFDKVELQQIEVTPEERERALSQVAPEEANALRLAAERIRRFHERQRRTSWFHVDELGGMVGQMLTPLRRVGVYVPGGLAVYPSSVLMCAIPAKVAGVEEVILCTPPRQDGTVHPLVLLAAQEAGVDRLFKVGGAQAVAAMAYGTQSIPPVDKIVGPGNVYVTVAKKLVYGLVGIDMLAGPSEVCILADESANARFVAIDMLTQAEHDVHTAAFLITPCAALAQAVQQEIERAVDQLPRRDILQQTLAQNGGIIVTRDMDEAVELANLCAPEHLALMVAEPWRHLPRIRCAGAILIGDYSPQSLGDYVAGPSHTLPTSGTARYASPLHVDDFVKKTSVVSFTREALQSVAPAIEALAQAEGLEAHRRAVRWRLGQEGEDGNGRTAGTGRP